MTNTPKEIINSPIKTDDTIELSPIFKIGDKVEAKIKQWLEYCEKRSRIKGTTLAHLIPPSGIITSIKPFLMTHRYVIQTSHLTARKDGTIEVDEEYLISCEDQDD